MGQRPLVMWSAVCSAPHSQLSFVDNPQRSMLAPNLPTPVRSLFSRVQARRDRPTPCPLFDGVGMNLCSLVVVDAHDSAHLACVQCFTVSCGGTEDTSIQIKATNYTNGAPCRKLSTRRTLIHRVDNYESTDKCKIMYN